MCAQGTTEEEDLENIQDAIVDYLSVVDELTQESEIRYVEVARDTKTFESISQKSD
jgi:predicted RNase H-like HicB family nuclease